MSKESPWLILLPLGLFLFLRWQLLSHLVFGNYAQVAAFPFAQENVSMHPILAVAVYRAWFLVFGWERLRWAPFLFSLGVFALTWLAARRALGFRGALTACFLLAITPESLFGSSQIYIDGAILPFFLMSFYCLYAPLSASPVFRPRRLLACGLAYGLMWLSKYSALPLLASFGLHSLLTRGLRITLRDFGLILLAGAAVFAPYPLLYPEHYGRASGKIGLALATLAATKAATPLGVYATSFSKAFIFVGPLLLCALASALLKAEWRKTLSLPLCVCLAYMAAIFVLLNPHNTVQYWMPVVPLLCLIAAKALGEWLGPAPRLQGLLGWVALDTAVLALLTLAGPAKVRPIHPRLPWTFSALFEFLPIRLYLGPSPALYLKPAALLFSFGGCLALWAMAPAWPKARRQALALGLAYGLFFSLEYGRAILSPSVDRAAKQVMATLRQRGLPKPIYLHGLGEMNCELAGVMVRYFTYDVVYLSRLIKTMERTRGSVVLIEAPVIGEEAELRRFLRERALPGRTFADRGITMAEIWTLPSRER